MGSVARPFMRKGFLIYEEMRKCLTIYESPLVIYDFATDFVICLIKPASGLFNKN
jgi:hypothetical protein